MLIYCAQSSPRLKYTLKLVFEVVLQTTYELTSDVEFFKTYDGPKLSYGLQPLEDEFFIKHKELLFDQGIIEYEILTIPLENTQAIFPTPANPQFPFDVFSACFYMVSRYEEYLPHHRDQFDRFDAKESIAYKAGFIYQPVVNIWCEFLWERLFQRFPNIKRKHRKYKMITTIDVDNAFAYKEKGLVRTVAGFVKNILLLDFKELKERISVMVGAKTDPYDTYAYQLDLIKKHKLEVIYFFLLGDYGHKDKNISTNSAKFRSLIKSLSDYAQVGIHPSYNSNESFKKLQKEVARLSNIVHVEVVNSRQHYLKLKLPDTYRNLLELNIEHDYTMGYACFYGFRAGICLPFNFYDMDLELETSLKIHPFAIMEGSLKDYMSISPENAFEHYKKLIDEVKAVNGEFISLWHNDSIRDSGIWEGWRKVFEDMIDYGQS